MKPKTPKTPRMTSATRSLRDALASVEPLDSSGVLNSRKVLGALDPSFRTLGRSLTWLAAYADDEELRARAFRLLHGAFTDPGFPQRLRGKIERQAMKLADKDLRNSALTDVQKLPLLGVLGLMGHELTPDELDRCFDDFEGTLESLTRDAGARLVDAAECVEATLEAAGLGDVAGLAGVHEDDLVRALNVAAIQSEANGTVGATVLLVMCAIGNEMLSPPDEALSLAVDAAVGADPERSLYLLTEFGCWPNSRVLGNKARALSFRLRAQGIRPKPVPCPVFARGLVSSVDGAGSRALQLLYGDEDRLDGLTLIVNDRVGLKDVWLGAGVGEELERRARETDMSMVPCSVEFARDLLADALATNELSGFPVPGRWLLYRSYLGAAPLSPQARTPNLSAYPAKPNEFERITLVASDVLADHGVYDSLGFDSEAAYAFVRSRVGADETLEITADLVSEFLSAVEEHERERLTRRIAVNLEGEDLAGRAREPFNQLAAVLWRALDQATCPFEELTYARKLAEQSLRAITHNVGQGFRSQDEANAAAAARAADLDPHAMLAEMQDSGLF